MRTPTPICYNRYIMTVLGAVFALVSPALCHAGTWQTTVSVQGTATGQDKTAFRSQPVPVVWTNSSGTWAASSLCRAAQSVAASSTGTVTTTFQWQPTGGDMTADPPPKTVMVFEQASAGVTWGDSPQAGEVPLAGAPNKNVSIGDIPANVQDEDKPGAKIKQGKRIKKHEVSGSGSVSITANLSATVTVQASSSLKGQCGASALYGASISSIRIQRDGANITDANDKCLPGEAINLSVTGADTGSTYNWNITGDIFKNFTPSTPSVYEGEGAVVKTDPTITYRYIKGDTDGSKKKVNVTVKVDGKSVDVEDELKVYQPTFTFKATQGGPYADSGGVILERPRNVSVGSGMDWVDTTVNTSSYGAGIFGFAQTGNVSRTKYVGAVPYNLPPSASSGLDLGFPYGGYTLGTGAVVGKNGAAGAGDSPGDSYFESLTRQYDRIKLTDNYETWLMFQSTAAGASWVPLGKISWTWTADVTKPTVINAPATGKDVAASETTTFPSWTTQINPNVPYVP